MIANIGPDDFAAARIRETAAASVAARKAEIDAAWRAGWLAGRDAAVKRIEGYDSFYDIQPDDAIRALQPPEPGKEP